MSEVVRLPAVKRIEGHGHISLFLDDNGRVQDAHFDITEFRGFEKMLLGRMVWEMPLITSRICGVCPVSHHVAAVKAVDAMYEVKIPRPARLLREVLHLGAFTQDHALHFFFLAGPDFLTGDGKSSTDILGVVQGSPELALKAIGLRKTGQRIVELVGGRASHPVAAIPGGMSRALAPEARDEILASVREGFPEALAAAEIARQATRRLMEANPTYGASGMPMMAQLGPEEAFDLYEGQILVAAPDGSVIERFDARGYADHIGERVLPNSYAKAPYLLSLGPEKGSYRVGPLPRINMTASMPGPHSSELLDSFRSDLGRPVNALLAYNWARMIELVACYERLTTLLEDDEIVSDDVRVKVERGPGSGTAAIEAPRGTLVHHYEADDVGRVTKADLVVATTHNTSSLDGAVRDAALGLDGEEATDKTTIRRMEIGIRAHDPCLSCATHEFGRMPLSVSIVNAAGEVLDVRGAV